MIFCDELKYKLNQDSTSYVDYNKFQNILCDVLNKHAPIKKEIFKGK